MASPMLSGRLGPGERAAALRALATGEPLDVLVVGGGVVGAGAALDAATRGLRVGLVEARDWASGTSSRSSKLIHGGLRYLEMLDLALVREALRERGLLLRRLAPHLVRPVPFLFPLRSRGWQRLYVGAGIALYDALGHSTGDSRGLPRHRHLRRAAALTAAPGLRADALVGAVQYWDGQVDDARHTLTLVRTAAAYGAHCVSGAHVVELTRDGDRVTGVRVRDLGVTEDGGGDGDGRELTVRARQVVLATGVWTDDLSGASPAGPAGSGGTAVTVRASKGVHLLVRREAIASTTGLILRTPTSVLFVIPWGRPEQTHWIVGTTDTAWDLDRADPAASAADVAYLLGQVNEVLATPLTRADVVGVYAGLRPLLAGAGEVTARLSREHAVERPAPGLVVVAGGKYTTYRVMAQDAVDEAAAALRAEDGRRVPASVTADVPLLGAAGYLALVDGVDRLAAESGLPAATVERLLGRYGGLVGELFELMAGDPTLAAPLGAGAGYLRAEIVYAATAEGARGLDDVLDRRTHLAVETEHRGVDCLDEVVALLAPVLGWGAARCRREAQRYRARVAAERAAQDSPDDAAADALQRRALDVVPSD